MRVGVLFVVGGCIGAVPGGAGPGSSDAAIDAPKLMWPDSGVGSGSTLPCRQPAQPPGDGHHNPGKSCFQACHNHGWTLAGTLYTNATGNTAFSGATISITGNN